MSGGSVSEARRCEARRVAVGAVGGCRGLPASRPTHPPVICQPATPTPTSGTHSAGQPSIADDAPAPMAIATVLPPLSCCSVPSTRRYVCSRKRFMPNCTAVMGSIAPALTCRAQQEGGRAGRQRAREGFREGMQLGACSYSRSAISPRQQAGQR